MVPGDYKICQPDFEFNTLNPLYKTLCIDLYPSEGFWKSCDFSTVSLLCCTACWKLWLPDHIITMSLPCHYPIGRRFASCGSLTISLQCLTNWRVADFTTFGAHPVILNVDFNLCQFRPMSVLTQNSYISTRTVRHQWQIS